MEPKDEQLEAQPAAGRPSATVGPPRAIFAPPAPTAPLKPQLRDFAIQFVILVINVFVVLRVLWAFNPLLAAAALYVSYRFGAFRFIPSMTTLIVGATRRSAMQEALRRCDTMSAPVTEKLTKTFDTALLRVAECSMQGWRRSMEDAHSLVPILLRGGSDAGLLDTVGFFGVFDGHCGSTIAQFCGAQLHAFVANTEAFLKGDYETALVEGFITADKHLLVNPQFQNDRSGCTAISVLLAQPKSGSGPVKLYCANAGDSRAILCRAGRCIPLSTDHKPHSAIELRRIQAAKSFVWNRRVNGVLALSRAIGDFAFKGNSSVPWEEQAVTCVPDVHCMTLEPGQDEFIVIACDGIWDVMSNEDVSLFVRQNLLRGVAVKEVAERLVSSCLSPSPFGIGCDNMSVILLVFRDANAFALQ